MNRQAVITWQEERGMGQWIIVCVGFCVLMVIVIPSIIVKGCSPNIHTPTPKQDPTNYSVNVFMATSNEISTMDLEEYIKGVVAAEMPASFGIEALKAQAVAARTITLRQMLQFGGCGCAKNPGADICTDHRHCQAWISREELQERIGHINYLSYSKKIQDAVNATKGLVATYKGDLIEACYHAASGGATDNSEEVWSNPAPYLKGVSTQFESMEPDFQKEISFTMDELERVLGINFREEKSSTYNVAGKDVHVISQVKMEKPIEILGASKAGRIKEIRIGDKVFEGSILRNLLGLASTKMTYRIADNRIYIITTGYGHGVGMSQYGANVMANAGENFKDILKHYYQGIEIVDYSQIKIR